MRYPKHSRVYVASLKRDGVVVRESKDGVYDVSVGSLVFHLPEKDLSPARGKGDDEPVSVRKKAAKAKRGSAAATRTAFIDLHGMRVEEALAAVERKIDQALTDGADRLDVMHGIGSGKLKSALHRYFGSLGVVKRYKLADGNPGMTWVFF